MVTKSDDCEEKESNIHHRGERYGTGLKIRFAKKSDIKMCDVFDMKPIDNRPLTPIPAFSHPQA